MREIKTCFCAQSSQPLLESSQLIKTTLFQTKRKLSLLGRYYNHTDPWSKLQEFFLAGLRSLICVKNWTGPRKLVTFFPLVRFCSSLLFYTTSNQKCLRENMYFSIELQQLVCETFGVQRGTKILELAKEVVSISEMELAVHQEAKKQNYVRAV